ncbi:hypothetical protein [Nocardia carnea]|uniref:hypothetical protein n=1 Tax=Nocardia carnea TaxID=37328 RepID=UPI0002D3C749|nr:hypothetical protein [Nocardia carnea]
MRIHWTLFAVAVIVVATLAGCGRDDTDPGPVVIDISAPPPGATWQLYRGVYVPYTAAGPADTSGAAPARYEHTPQGAVAAAMQGQARLSLAPDDSWPAVTTAVTVAGPGRDRFALERVMASITAPADPGATAQYAGFRLESWSLAAVTVWLATRMPTGQLSAQPTRMVWHAGDWKIELPATVATGPDGRVPTDPVALENLYRYTEFHR